MSIGSISSLGATMFQSMRGKHKQGDENFNALAKALNSNDIAGAQKAFAALQADAKSGTNKDQGKAAQAISPATTAFKSLAEALSSGDLAGAQGAFAALQKAITARGHGHHHTSATDALATALLTPPPPKASINIAAMDADGDNDGSSSVGGRLNLKA